MKRHARAAATRIGARIVAALLQAATLVLIAREAGPASFGVFAQAQSIGLLAAAVSGLGLTTRALRLAADENPKPIVSAMYLLRLSMSMAVAFLVLFIFTVLTDDASVVILAAVSVLFADMLSDLTQGVLSGLQHQGWASVLLVLHRIAPFAAVWFMPLPDANIYWNFMVGCWLSAVLAFVYPAVTWCRPLNIFRLVGQSRGFWLASIVGPLNNLDTTIIRTVMGATAVGYYSAGARFGAPINLVTSSLLNIFVPEMAKQKDIAKQYGIFIRIRKFGIWICLLAMGFAPATAEIIVRLLGEAYRPGWWIFCGIIIAASLSGINQVYQAYQYAKNTPKNVALAVGSGTVIGLALLAVGGFVFGIGFLAISPILTQLIILSYFVYQTRGAK